MFYWKYHFNIIRFRLIICVLISFNPCFTGSTTSTSIISCDSFIFSCFNPCFTGSTTSTLGTRGALRPGIFVSILVLLEVPLQPNIIYTRQGTLKRFNPCFTGSTTSTFLLLSSYLLFFTFQSLFYWKYHFNSEMPYIAPILIFVSILVLLEVPLQLLLSISILFAPHVSILVLLEVPLQQYRSMSVPFPVSRFNPCFTGSTTSTFTIATITFMILTVSILVLLEVPLQHEWYPNTGHRTLSFNPCFTGSTTSTRGKGKIYPRTRNVSILVLLEVPLQLDLMRNGG